MLSRTQDHAPPSITTLTRRDALHWLVGALVGSITGARLPPSGTGHEAVGVSLAALRLDALLPLVGERFLVGYGDDTLSLILEQACDLRRAHTRTRTADPGPECFSLLFGGSADAPLGQGTYRFAHDALGTLWLFIVPMAADGTWQLYEAVINHQRPDGAASGSGQIR